MRWPRCCRLFQHDLWVGSLSLAVYACSGGSAEVLDGENPPRGSEGSAGMPGAGHIQPTSGLWVMGYYSSWDADLYPVDSIDWSSLTHIATAFHVPDGAGGLYGPESIEPALAEAVVRAAHAAGKKAIASIGGEGAEQVFKSSMSAAHLGAFLENLQSLVTGLGYDGVDLDWEGGPEEDRALLLALARELRAAMPDSIITVPVGLENANVKRDLSFYGELAGTVDQINLMSYNLAGAYDGWKSWHSSPLHWNGDTATPVSIDHSVAAYLEAAVPASKLGIGAGFFGQCYSAPVTGPGQVMAESTLVAHDGVMSYAHIMSTYHSESARQWDAMAAVPYLSFAAPTGPEGCTYITYEDPASIAVKAAWARSRGLGGAILWTINEGYMAQRRDGRRHPLLDAAGFAFLR